MKALFVVNPISGGLDKTPFLNHAELVCRKYAIEYEIFKTTGENDNFKLQKVLKKFKPDRVAAIGGDGTTLFCGTNLIKSKIPLGIIPFGSANGMATELNVNQEPDLALYDFLLSQYIADLDLILVNNKHYCLHIGDVGLNAAVVEGFTNDENRGMLTYAKHFISEVRKATPFEVEIETDEKSIVKKTFMVALANSRKYGTGVVLNHKGNPFDGKFEVGLVRNIDIDSLVKAGLTKYFEDLAEDYSGISISCTKAKIKLEKPMMLQLDGELIGKVSEIKAEVVPRAVKFITHSENPFLS
ncbi:diacylglycerol/lipid kinase family protein [Flexithrix dorotheae]|uniref:diacylglycerol/lipid kinase family protein n=1 Tax=Flexithrix dorotheae TaxID=70993 RepID=UPI000376366A|nr:diacylglycerol kinase family protein [Flexithrix dorotheae]